MKKQLITIFSIFLLIFLCSPFVLASYEVYVLDLEYADYFYWDYDSIEFVTFYAYWSSSSQTEIGTQIIIDEGDSSNFYFTEGEQVGAGEGEGYIYDNVDLRNVFGTAWSPTRHSFVSYRPYFFIPGEPTIFGDLLLTQYDNDFKNNLSTQYHIIGVVPEVLPALDVTGSSATLKGYVHYPDDKQYIYPTTRCKFWNQDYIEWSFIYRESDTFAWKDVNGAVFSESTFDSWERTNATASGNKCINEIYDMGSSQYESSVTGLKSNTNYQYIMVVKWTDGSNSEVTYSDYSTHLSSGSDGIRTFTTGTQDITEDIVSYYPVNDTLDIVSNNNLEDVINGNNGTLTGFTNNHGTVSGGVTIEDGAMVFDGVDGYVDTGLDSSDLSPTEITISVWFNRPTGVSIQRLIDYSNNAVITTGIRLQLINGKSRLHINDFLAETSTTAPTDSWVHYVGTYDSSDIKIYENGELKETTSYSGGINFTGTVGNLSIGKLSSANQYTTGDMSIAQIFNRALTQSEITEIYNAGKDSYSPVGNGLAGQWSDKDFNETTANPTNIYDTNNIVKGTQESSTALNFDGVDDYVDLGNDTFNILTDSQTISLWYNMNVFGTLDKLIDLGGRNFIQFSSNKIQYNLYDGSTTSSILSDDEFNTKTNEWVNVLTQFNGSEMSMYINGVKQTETEMLSGVIYNTSRAHIIGADYRKDRNFFDGAIDNVRIYNKALNETEILDLYYLDRPEVLSAPEIETLNVLNFTNSWANLRGSVISDNGNSDMEGFFNYGLNTTMTSQTTPESIAQFQTLTQQISSLEPGKTYYYKFCVNYAESQTCGDMLSFTTEGGEYSVAEFYMQLETESDFLSDTTQVNAYLNINTNMNYLTTFAGIQKSHPSEIYQNNIIIGSFGSDSFNGTYSNFFNRPLHAKYVIKGVLEINDTILLTANTKEIIQGIYARTRTTGGVGITSATLRGQIETDDQNNPTIPQQCTFWGKDNLTVYFRYSELGESNWRYSDNVTLTDSCTGGTFSVNVNDLIANTNYVYNVRFVYEDVEYSSLITSIEYPTQSFKTLSDNNTPVVETLNPSDITTSQGKLNGFIVDMGNYTEIETYFRYYIFNWVSSPKVTVTSAGSTSYLLTSLPQGQEVQYYICVEYADSTYCDTANTKTFTTEGESLGNVPVIETLNAINVGDDTATLTGSIWDFGDYPQVKTYFEYTTAINLQTPKITWSGLGSPTEEIKDLIPGTTFTYKLCVEYGNNFELSYCAAEKSLTTTGITPHTDIDPITGESIYTTPGSFNDMIQQILGSQSQQMKNLLAVVIVAMFIIMGFSLTKSMIAGFMMGVIGLIIAFVLGLFGVWVIILITIMLSMPVVYYLIFNRGG